MNEFLMHWLIALAVILLLLAALYLVIRLAVRGAIKEAFREIAGEIAKEVWKDEEKLSVPVEIILDEDRHVKNQQDGLFDQIEKDLDIILGW